jgi:hypothetical protein
MVDQFWHAAEDIVRRLVLAFDIAIAPQVRGLPLGSHLA